MSNRVNKFLLIACILIPVSWATSVYGRYSPNLENSLEGERLLRRYDATIKPFYDLYIKPYRYASVYLYMSSIDSTSFTHTDLKRRDEFLRMIDPGYGLVKWHHAQRDVHLRLHLSLVGDVKASLHDESSLILKGIIHPSLTGNIGSLSFFSGIDVWTEYRSDTVFHQSSYQPYDGVAYNLYGRNTDSASVRASDLPRGGISYDAGAVKFEAAIDYLKCGPSLYYPLTLSGTAPPITYVKTDLDLGIITYTHIAGLLRAQKDKEKFIYFHRIGAPLLDGLIHLGINEVIINGSTIDQNLGDSNRVRKGDDAQLRSLELVYLIPFVPFKFVEHYAGDRDNAAISFDLTLRWPNRFRWYGEFFLDDMLAPWKILSNDWGNKWALTVGFQYSGVLKNRDIQVDLEYSHVEPWVYTHFFGGSHRYTNFDKCLGSPLGPNSQALIALFQIALHPQHEIGLGLSYVAKNTSVRGGTINHIFQYPDREDSTRFIDSETKHFLGEGTVSEFGPVVSYVYNPFGFFQIRFRYELDLIHNSGSSKMFLNGGFVF